VSDPVVGAPPTAAQKAAFGAAANLAPDKSLARIQELAKFVFSNVAVVGTLLAGLGLFTNLGNVLANSWKLPSPFEGVPVAVAALGLSLFCASLAIWPKMSNVDSSRLAEVKAWYRRQIFRRGVWMILSLALFSLAILVATFTGIGDDDDPAKPAISASWTGIGADATVKVSVGAESVPGDWTMVTVVQGRKSVSPGHKRPPKAKWMTIFRDRTRPNADGELAVSGEINVGKRFTKVRSAARLYPHEKHPHPHLQSDLVLKRG
jgi:hypothetical protein